MALVGGLNLIREDLLQLGVINDPHFDQNTRFAIPSLGFGAHYSKRNFYIGFSLPQLLVGNSEEANRNYFINAGTVFRLDRNWLLKSNGLIKYVVGAPVQFDVNSIFSYRRRFDIGIGYRSLSSLNFLTGFTISKNIRIVYFYSIPTQAIPLNTHSLLLNVRIRKGFGAQFIE